MQVYHVEVSGVKSDIAVIVYPVLQANGEDKQRRKDRPESEPNCFPPVCKLEKVAGSESACTSRLVGTQTRLERHYCRTGNVIGA